MGFLTSAFRDALPLFPRAPYILLPVAAFNTATRDELDQFPRVSLASTLRPEASANAVN
jgi:hypothetical protein